MRPVARVLRSSLFVVGLVLLIWTPISLFVWVLLWIPSAGEPAISIEVECGYIKAGIFPYKTVYTSIGLTFRAVHPDTEIRVVPSYYFNRVDDCFIIVPLWLLAAICLAWPVTSFIIARRRHKRGFPVEPKAGGEAVSPPVSSS